MSDNKTFAEQRFNGDVAEHEMVVLLEGGAYRHIRFKKPGTINMYFDLITYPGHLVYSGDMGYYVFQRVEDMFTFFRNPEGRSIDFNYWAEKVQAEDRSGVREYSPERFEECINSYMDDMEEGDTPPEMRQAIREEVLDYSDYEYEARQAADQFEWENKRIFQDFYEYDCQIFTYRFIWACYAIAWGIRQYDNRKEDK